MADTQTYVLREGAKFHTVENGVHTMLVGKADGSVTVNLTEVQAEAFKDKLLMTTPEVVIATPASKDAPAGPVPKGKATT